MGCRRTQGYQTSWAGVLEPDRIPPPTFLNPAWKERYRSSPLRGWLRCLVGGPGAGGARSTNRTHFLARGASAAVAQIAVLRNRSTNRTHFLARGAPGRSRHAFHPHGRLLL